MCIGVAQPGFWEWEGYRVAPESSCLKLPHVQQRQLLLAPKVDRLLAKAGPIRKSGNASVIKYLRRNQNKSCVAVSLETREKWSENNNSADTQVSGEGGAGDATGEGGEGIFEGLFHFSLCCSDFVSNKFISYH